MTNTSELRAAIARKNITYTEIAKRMGLSRAGFYKKLNNQSEFKVSEMKKLCEILSLTNEGEIFYS